MPATLYNCVCCARMLEGFHFAPSGTICRTCSTLPAQEVATKVLALAHAAHAARTGTRAGRRQMKRERLLAIIARDGKRCMSCHARKPASAFGLCEPRTDGLQPECRMCIKVRTGILATEGATRATWYTLRDALRAQAGEKINPPAPLTATE